jgi:TolA-binding protein
MSEQRFINAYIDLAVGALHENISTILQLKAQLRVANEIIEDVKKQLVESQNNNQIIQTLRDNASRWEQQANALTNKASLVDALTNQVNDMKQQIISKNSEIDELKQKVETLSNSQLPPKHVLRMNKKVINTEEPKTVTTNKTLDDFN